jgi:outer membrane protein assembly factor BamE
MLISPRHTVVRLLIPAMILFGTAACSFPGVYKLDVQQGNIISQDMVNQLKPGMNKRQVRFIMGTPLLMDSFNDNRWDYFYSLKNDEDEFSQERLTLFFSEDKLVNLQGNFRPEQQTAQRATATHATHQDDESLESGEERSNVKVYLWMCHRSRKWKRRHNNAGVLIPASRQRCLDLEARWRLASFGSSNKGR